ncbi:MAG: nucleotide sugar dehydrogenase, partial [Phycisphaeraceae bacterium]
MSETGLNVAIFGMGYVGTACAAFLASDGCHVCGVDRDPDKHALLNHGQVPFYEPGLGERLRAAIEAGRFTMATDAAQAAREADVCLICVGTPSDKCGRVATDSIEHVGQEIGDALRKRDGFSVIALRSTSPPGTVETLAQRITASSDRARGTDFEVVSNPEFLREGSALKDLTHPPFTIVGSECDRAVRIMAELYRSVDAPFVQMVPREAELLKYACNAFHALKVAFANEIGELARLNALDAHRLMETFCKDDRLNIS